MSLKPISEVFDQAVAGLPPKEIAHALDKVRNACGGLAHLSDPQLLLTIIQAGADVMAKSSRQVLQAIHCK